MTTITKILSSVIFATASLTVQAETQLHPIVTASRIAQSTDQTLAAVTVITRGLKRIGLLEGSVPKLIKDGAYKEFFMHRTGHWIGMDVHDVGDYKVGDEWRHLESGMVTTVQSNTTMSGSLICCFSHSALTKVSIKGLLMFDLGRYKLLFHQLLNNTLHLRMIKLPATNSAIADLALFIDQVGGGQASYAVGL